MHAADRTQGRLRERLQQRKEDAGGNRIEVGRPVTRFQFDAETGAQLVTEARELGHVIADAP